MRILYVTLLWNGFEDLICDGHLSAKGMPAFVEPLKRLVKKGHVVDIAIVGENQRALNIGPEWLKGSQFFWVNQWSFTKLLPLVKIIRRGHYDFVYAQGGAAGWGNLAAMLARKPCGVRVYGTFLAEHLNKSWWGMFRASPLEVLTHNMPKRFMIITNDGTKGDLVNQKCCLLRGLYDFKFWLNGVDKAQGGPSGEPEVKTHLASYGLDEAAPFLLYAARYEPWKRQDFAVEILTQLARAGERRMQLFCCGHINDQAYHDHLLKTVEREGLRGRVRMVGPLPKDVLRKLYQEALVTFSLYDLSNLGNVLIEAAAEGAVVITRKDGTTDFIVKHGETGFQISDPGEPVPIILDLLADPGKRQAISTRMKQLADSVFETWDQRAIREIELIEGAVRADSSPKGLDDEPEQVSSRQQPSSSSTKQAFSYKLVHRLLKVKQALPPDSTVEILSGAGPGRTGKRTRAYGVRECIHNA